MVKLEQAVQAVKTVAQVALALMVYQVITVQVDQAVKHTEQVDVLVVQVQVEPHWHQ
jgi:hypothetical protein